MTRKTQPRLIDGGMIVQAFCGDCPHDQLAYLGDYQFEDDGWRFYFAAGIARSPQPGHYVRSKRGRDAYQKGRLPFSQVAFIGRLLGPLVINSPPPGFSIDVDPSAARLCVIECQNCGCENVLPSVVVTKE